MRDIRWEVIILCALALGASAWYVWAALPNQIKAARMTNATLAVNIDDEVGNLEKALGDILGIPMDTNIAAALFSVDATGLKKVIFQDNAGDPSATGQVVRSGAQLKFHDGTAVRTLSSLNATEVLTGKTMNAADNVIHADDAVALASNGGDCAAGTAPLGVDSNGTVENCFDVATQTELDTHTNATTSVHGAVSTNTASKIVIRDASGNFAAGTITAALTGTVTGALVGNADTATALANNGANCTAGNAPLGVNAAGAVESCFDVATQAELDAVAAGGMSSDGANCAAGNAPLGVDQLGAVQDCFDVATQAELDTHTTATTSVHGAVSTNTASKLVIRDASGNFAAGAITADLTGDVTGTLDGNMIGGTIVGAVVINDSNDSHTIARPNIAANDTMLLVNAVQNMASKVFQTGTIEKDVIIKDANDTHVLTRPDVQTDDTFATLNATQEFTGKTINAANNTLTNIPNTSLKSTTGEALFIGPVAIIMNTYTFFPKFEQHTCNVSTANVGSLSLIPENSADDTVGAVQVHTVGACSSGTYRVGWRYLTASRPPEMVAMREIATGKIVGLWRSEIDNTQQAPLIAHGDDAANYEPIYLADFPREFAELSLTAILARLSNNTNRLRTVARSGAAKTTLETTARNKGRVVISSLPMAEVE